MTTGWRIEKTRHVDESFTGEGARLFGGRWNHKGTPVVYLSDSLALSALEKFVHMGKAASALSLVAIEVVIPEGVAVDALPALPANWREEPPPDETKDLGTGWVQGGAAAVLRVPSAIIPNENNFVINPRHPDFGRLEIKKPQPFSFDPRMWK